jgi:hypothetical protein
MRSAARHDYALDDGFNGCTLVFDDDEGYHADIDVGPFIDG